MERVTVAVLEEQAFSRELLADALRSGGLEVLAECAAAGDLLAVCTRTPPNVALVSLATAHGELLERGYQILRTLAESHPDVSPLVLATLGEPAHLQRLYREGAAGVLWRGNARRQDVIGAIRELAAGRRFYPPDLLTLDVPDPAAQHVATPLRDVTSREREVLALVAGGDDNLKIAAKLDITERTVRAHVSALYRKLNCENRAQLAVTARQLGAHARLH